ncbi:MAG: sugar phosphate isomerase/epimerase [Planctomycetia bacterium]|nr:sugar phosphate isomerase/epimerase [Planctomycetia bacterium]
MDRRSFIKTGLGAAALGVSVHSFSSSLFAAEKRIPIALQLYSVRDQMAKDVAGTIKKVAAIGYKGIEFAGYYNMSAKDLRKIADDNGLLIVGTHLKVETLIGEEFEKTVEFNKILGNSHLTVSSGLAGVNNIDGPNRIAANLFNELSIKAEAVGMHIGYHAHGNDFEIVQGKKITGWDLFFQRTRKEVMMQMDAGNCLKGGGDPYLPIKKFPGRTLQLHAKPGGAGGVALGSPEDTVDWKRIFDLCESVGGTQWYIVEQSPAKDGDSIATAKACFEGLKKLGKC